MAGAQIGMGGRARPISCSASTTSFRASTTCCSSSRWSCSSGTAGCWLKTITAFTVAHSITLAGASLGYFSLPQKPVEAAIALSIAFVATELVKMKPGREATVRSLSLGRRLRLRAAPRFRLCRRAEGDWPAANRCAACPPDVQSRRRSGATPVRRRGPCRIRSDACPGHSTGQAGTAGGRLSHRHRLDGLAGCAPQQLRHGSLGLGLTQVGAGLLVLPIAPKNV